MQKYGDQIAPLERASSQTVGLPLLSFVNISLLCLSVGSGTLPVPAVVALAVFPGSVLSLWQLQLLHDVVHGSFFDKGSGSVWGVSRKEAQERLLFWGSMPSIFGYYLYLKYGHLSHHKNLGDPEKATLEQLFDSAQADFEDGDVLFVAHRMKLKGNIGPKIPLPGGKELKLSISDSGFQQWREGNASWNAAVFAASFLFERYAVAFNDIFVAATGRNFYFPNKPESFHNDCASYARWALLVRGSLLATVGWKALLFLFLSETLWSIPPHPACAMFVTNHGSHMNEDGQCVPTSSTYAGRWYEYFTLNTGRSGNWQSHSVVMYSHFFIDRMLPKSFSHWAPRSSFDPISQAWRAAKYCARVLPRLKGTERWHNIHHEQRFRQSRLLRLHGRRPYAEGSQMMRPSWCEHHITISKSKLMDTRLFSTKNAKNSNVAAAATDRA